MSQEFTSPQNDWPLRPFRCLMFGFVLLFVSGYSYAGVHEPAFYLLPAALGAAAGFVSLTIRTHGVPVLLGFAVPLFASWYLRSNGHLMQSTEPLTWITLYFGIWQAVLGAGAYLNTRSERSPSSAVR